MYGVEVRFEPTTTVSKTDVLLTELTRSSVSVSILYGTLIIRLMGAWFYENTRIDEIKSSYRGRYHRYHVARSHLNVPFGVTCVVRKKFTVSSYQVFSYVFSPEARVSRLSLGLFLLL